MRCSEGNRRDNGVFYHDEFIEEKVYIPCKK